MNFLKGISSLKKKALYHVALNLSQDNSFKEVAMCLEKPTYGIIPVDRGHVSVHHGPLSSNPQTKAELWDVAVEEQCQRLTEGFPNSFKHELHVWINRFALEYLSYCQRQESLFDVSRYFLMNILTREDWTEDGRLNEIKIAKRLLRDKQLTNLQKYRITCVYCFERSIPRSWIKLTQEEKQALSTNDDHHYEENRSLVSLWCDYMKLHQNVELAWQKRFLWEHAAVIAVRYGNKTAFMFFWQKICKRDRPLLIINMALLALESWKIAEVIGIKREKLVSNKYCSLFEAPYLNLPHYYSELLRFLLSEMCESEILEFFEKAFEMEDNESESITARISVLECFLDWPLQDYFLHAMNLLRGTISMNKYGLCLFLLARRYSGELKRYYSSTSVYTKIHYCDYGSMLWNLWKATPDEYKQYVFYDDKQGSDNYSTTWIKGVLLQLLKKDPFEKRDVALFKEVWLDLPQEIRRAMVEVREPHMRLTYGDDICWILLEKEMWSLANWLLERNFPDKEIPNYKKQLIESRDFYCFSKLEENSFKFVEDLMDWCLLADTEKTKFKYELFTNQDCGLDLCSNFLTKGEFTKVEKIIDFCLSSDVTKEEFKIECGEKACRLLVDDCEWELMDKILTWCNKSEENILEYKKFMFFRLGFSVHYRLVFVLRDWENLECFYKWFCLSPEEIIKIKKETVFMPQMFEKIHEALYKDDIDEIETCLRWCLTNEEIVNDFEEEVKKQYFNTDLENKNDKQAKLCFYLLSRLLYSLRKEVVHNVTNTEDISMKDKGEKRFSGVEDGSSSAKRLRHKTIKHC